MATINRHHECRTFSEHNYFACFDKDFEIEWCDNYELFRRIVLGNKRIQQKIESATEKTIVHYFLYKGVYHRALIERTTKGGFVFKVAKEIVNEKLIIDDLFEYLDEISHNCLNILTVSDIIEEYAENTGYNNDFFHEHFNEQRKATLGIYNYCANILKIFNNKENEEFIPLQKYLFRTLDIIQHVVRKLPIKITMYSDLVFPATKINYSKLELALYNLIKFAMIHTAEQEELHLSVKRESLDEISVEMNFRVKPDFKFSDSKIEMHIIKYLFRILNGHFEFYEEGNMLCAKGVFTAEFSLNSGDIAQNRDIEFIDDPEIMKKKATSDKYVRIYRNITSQNKAFASNMSALSDVEDECVRFAELFFGDIVL